jgi:hypothetical protein
MVGRTLMILEYVMVDKLFTKLLILFGKFVRLFVPKPKFGSIDVKRSDSLKDKR